MIAFERLFSNKKPIIGMIHLAGRDSSERVSRALEELALYDREGVDGAIVEDYHGGVEDLFSTLGAIIPAEYNLVIGLNFLRGDHAEGFRLAKGYKLPFVQFDTVQDHEIPSRYDRLYRNHASTGVLGGVGFKYTSAGNLSLQQELTLAQMRCSAIVTTGDGTGIATPLEKLREYRQLLGDFPLVVGAGVNADNAYKQLQVADGAIIGSYFKEDSDTRRPIDRGKVREIMDITRKVRDSL